MLGRGVEEAAAAAAKTHFLLAPPAHRHAGGVIAKSNRSVTQSSHSFNMAKQCE